MLRSEKFRRLEGENGVALLDQLEVVVVIAEGAMKAVVVHFSQDNLRRGRTEKLRVLCIVSFYERI